MYIFELDQPAFCIFIVYLSLCIFFRKNEAFPLYWLFLSIGLSISSCLSSVAFTDSYLRLSTVIFYLDVLCITVHTNKTPVSLWVDSCLQHIQDIYSVFKMEMVQHYLINRRPTMDMSGCQEDVFCFNYGYAKGQDYIQMKSKGNISGQFFSLILLLFYFCFLFFFFLSN